MPKTQKSAVTEKCQKVAGLRSQKNAKKLQVRGYRKMKKLADQQSQKSVRNSQVHVHGKLQKTGMSSVSEKY